MDQSEIKQRREASIARVKALTGSSDEAAKGLVEAALDAAIDQTLEVIMGSGPLPQSVSAANADRARYICQQAKRILNQREVEILFRTTPAKARSILTTMRATYEESLRDQFLQRMRDDATVRSGGTADTELTWSVTFTEQATFDLACSEIVRLGIAKQSQTNAARRTIEFPQDLQIEGRAVQPLKLLELAEPA